MPQVFVHEDHHQVLINWNQFPQTNIITLDYHTDTHPAFLGYSFRNFINARIDSEESNRLAKIEQQELIDGYNNKVITLENCISKLQHDEHIDFAVRTGIAKNVFVIPSGSNGNNGLINNRIFEKRHHRAYTGQPIIEYVYFCLPNCQRGPHDDNCLIDCALMAIDDEFLSHAVNYVSDYVSDFYCNYILDIDLDYFRTSRAFESNNISVFRHLAQNANLITIAKESVCLDMHKFEGDPINSDLALEAVINIINS